MTLKLFEEVLLLALKDEKGTVSVDFLEYALAGSIISELVLAGTIAIDSSKQKRVSTLNAKPLGDDILDEAMSLIRERENTKGLKHWISKIASIKNLKERVAVRLCDAKILKAEQEKVFLIFNRDVYPELDPVPEQNIIARIDDAITGKSAQIDARTVVLISIAHGVGLLRHNFDRDKLKRYKSRIEQIAKGEMVAGITREVIDACQAAVFIAVIMPTLITTVIVTS